MKNRIILAAMFIFLACLNLNAQDILKATAGSQITVQAGATLFVGGGINADNGSNISNAGNITIARTGAGTADLTDNTAIPYAYGVGKFVFIGTGGAQTMTGAIFYDLEINNAAGVSMLASE